MIKSTVIIPTTGNNTVKRCIESVVNQTIPTKMYVVVDGNRYMENIDFEYYRDYIRQGILQFCIIPENVGANGFYGHRIYAAFSHLVNTDYILYLDQDCYYEPNHVEEMLTTIEKENLDWSYSLRKIVDDSGNFICNDDCESLGKWNPVMQYNHIDTNCYCIKTNIATKICQVWHGGWGQDRLFYSAIHKHFPNYDCTGKYTLNYAVGGNEGSVKPEFFTHWNSVVSEQYYDNLPWRKND